MRNPLRPETIERISAAQTGKAAELTVVYALDHFRKSFKQQFSEMLKGNPYSQHVMDNALENIMRIAIDDEAHQNYGEVVDAEETATDWMREPTDAELQQIAEEEETKSYDFLKDEVYGQADLDGSDNRPSTNWREHGYY